MLGYIQFRTLKGADTGFMKPRGSKSSVKRDVVGAEIDRRRRGRWECGGYLPSPADEVVWGASSALPADSGVEPRPKTVLVKFCVWRTHVVTN